MSFTVEERFGSRRPAGSSFEFLFHARSDEDGIADELEARDAVLDAAPDEYDGLPRQGVSDGERISNRSLFFTVTYGATELGFDDELNQKFSFDTGGGTQHLTQSIATVAKYPPEAIDHKGAIGVNANGDVAGVDVPVSQFNFNVQRRMPIGDVTSAYVNKLRDLTGRGNSEAVEISVRPGVTLTFPAKELAFLGAAGGQVSQDDAEITFSFFSSKSKSDITIGGITGIAKKGLEYLWVEYHRATDGSGLASVPRAVYIEQVFEYDDLNELGLA